jgi:hypothetical protein
MRGSERHTARGSALFETWFSTLLDQLEADLRAALPGRLYAAALVGGFGRGEGGVLRTGDGESLSGDLDILVVVRGGVRRSAKALEALRRRYLSELSVSLDFMGPYTPGDLRRAKPELSWHSVAYSWKSIVGNADEALDLLPLRVWSNPWPEESARLFLRSGASILRALRALEGLETVADEDLIRRQYWRAALAMGDGLLVAWKRYTPFLEERSAALGCAEASSNQLRELRLATLYEKAIRYKLDPDSLPKAQPDRQQTLELAALWGLAFLAEERRRLGISAKNLGEYARLSLPREPRKRFRLIRRDSGSRAALQPRLPRERMYRELPELLGLTGKSPKGTEWERRSADFVARARRYR